MNIFYLLYLSAAASWFSDEELNRLLSVSQHNNRGEQITGVLLYGQGNFIQLLEGPEESVQMAFRRIKLDKRHSDVTVIASGTTGERYFPDWYMGFKAVEANGLEQMEAFINKTKEAVKQDDCQIPIRLLASFVTKNRLDL